jgi:uncharacterized coiled-coil protein SlyX
MLKKVLVGTAATLALGGLLVGTGLGSYARTGYGWMRDTVKDAVPVDLEIRRAREMIQDLNPEIAKNMQTIAREKVEVARLETELSRKQTQLTSAKGDILKLKGDLESDSPTYVYKGVSYSQQQVRDDLSKRFGRFKTQETTATKLTEMLNARRQCLTSAESRVEAMLQAKRDLEVEIENLEARLASVEVAQTQTITPLDDSQLANTRRLMDEIASRIDVQEQMLTISAEYNGSIELDEETTEGGDIVDEVANYFSNTTDEQLAIQ